MSDLTAPAPDGLDPEVDGTPVAEETDIPVPSPAPTGGRSGRILRSSLRPAVLYLASRVGMIVVAVSVASNVHRSLATTLTPWDSHWYLSIARSGYVTRIPPGSGNAAQSNLGFFPLLPVLIRFTHLVTRFDITDSGLVTTFLLGLAASVAVWWLLRDVFGSARADRGTALVFFSPGALVLSLVYTEGATILFVACTLLALRRHRWVTAGLCAALASTADPVAVAVVIPCVIAAVVAVRRRGDWRALVAPILAPCGVAAFFLYLWVHVGTPFAYIDAQRAGWQSGTYFDGIPTAFAQLFAHGFSDTNSAVKAISAVVAVGLLVIFFRVRPPATWVGYVVGVMFFGAMSPIIGITPRLILRGFPLLGVVGAKLPPLWFEVVLGLSVLCMAALGALAMGGPLWTP